MNMTTYEIDEKLLNAILQYLGTQPYQTVVGLITAIQQTATKQVEAKKQNNTEAE